MINLSEESLKNNEVYLHKVENIFIHVQKTTKKDIIKALNHCYKKSNSPLSVYVGKFINVEEGALPINVIGFPKEITTDEVYQIEKSIRKYFYKHVPFEYFSLDAEVELGEKLQAQGELLKIK